MTKNPFILVIGILTILLGLICFYDLKNQEMIKTLNKQLSYSIPLNENNKCMYIKDIQDTASKIPLLDCNDFEMLDFTCLDILNRDNNLRLCFNPFKYYYLDICQDNNYKGLDLQISNNSCNEFLNN